MTIEKMKPERRDEWVETLRSGEFKQVTGAFLFTSDPEKGTHCCLAVAAEVAARHGICQIIGDDTVYAPPMKSYELEDPDDENSYTLDPFNLDNYRLDAPWEEWVDADNDGELPKIVAAWFGVTDTNPEIAPGVPAISANDSLDWNFEHIAQAVSENL